MTASNINIADEFNLGWFGKSDTKSLLENMPQLVYKPSDNKDSFYWARADITR